MTNTHDTPTCKRCGTEKEPRAVGGGVGDGKKTSRTGTLYICPNRNCLGDE